MASYQDIEVRLQTVEAKLNFVMNSMRMKAVLGTGLFNADGSPAGKMVDGSLLDFYYLSQQQGVQSKVVDMISAPAPVTENVIGSENVDGPTE
jgi:hypothetical protein